jgi:hypothetical protein
MTPQFVALSCPRLHLQLFDKIIVFQDFWCSKIIFFSGLKFEMIKRSCIQLFWPLTKSIWFWSIKRSIENIKSLINFVNEARASVRWNERSVRKTETSEFHFSNKLAASFL